MPEDTTVETEGAVDESTADDTATDASDESDPEGADQLGDAGKKALDAMKAKWQAERTRRREIEAQLSEAARPKADDAKDAPDADAIRKEAETAAQQKANARIVRSEVKAAAAGKLADPADAYRFLDLDAFEVDNDGNVDEDEIAEAIDDLLKKKPYLAAAQGNGKRFQGGGDGGTRKESRPSQLSKADVQRLAAEGKHAEIEKARKEGRLDDLLSGKS